MLANDPFSSNFAAYVRDNTRQPIKSSSSKRANPFAFGGGHVRPNRAMNPGLVYDLTPEDYLSFLCPLGYPPSELKKITPMPHSCPNKSSDLLNFNYPSITVPNLSGMVNVTRTLKNVGQPGTYRVRIWEPHSISVSVEPEVLTFEDIGDEKKFKVIFEGKKIDFGGEYVFGRLKWTDGVHHVRSPLVVRVGNGTRKEERSHRLHRPRHNVRLKPSTLAI